MTDAPDDFDLHPIEDDRDTERVGIVSPIPSEVQPNPHDDILDQFPMEVGDPPQREHPGGIDRPGFVSHDVSHDVSHFGSQEAFDEASDDVWDGGVASAQPAHGVAWTMAVLLIGLAGGFGGGYLVGVRRPRVNTPATAAAVVAPVPPAASSAAAGPSAAAESTGSSGSAGSAGSPREYTENAIADSARETDRKPVEHSDRPSSGESNAVKDANRARVPSDQPATTGRLLVRSTPADAQVFVDDRDEGRTPATIRDLPLGAHRLRIVHEGYGVDERVIVVTATEPARSLTVDLEESRLVTDSPQSSAPSAPQSADEARVGTLSVESRPSGAQVFLDGKVVGTTPLVEVRLGPGWHAIRVERDGYRRWESSVSIEGGERNRITASLER